MWHHSFTLAFRVASPYNCAYLLSHLLRSDAFASAAVSLASGAVAGTAAAIFSQPADVILSQVTAAHAFLLLILRPFAWTERASFPSMLAPTHPIDVHESVCQFANHIRIPCRPPTSVVSMGERQSAPQSAPIAYYVLFLLDPSQVAQSASCETVERGVLPGTANKLALLAETGQRLLRTYGPSGLYLGLGEFVRHFRLISSLGGRGHARTDGRFFLSLRASPSGLCVGALCDWSLATVCETRYACAQHPSSLPLMLVLVSHQASSKLTSCVSLPRFSPPLTSLPPFLHCHYHQPLLIPPLKDHEWCGRVRSLLANSSCTTCSKTPCT